jgi:hypothetical protein
MSMLAKKGRDGEWLTRVVSYRPANRLHKQAESIPRLLKHLQIRAQLGNRVVVVGGRRYSASLIPNPLYSKLLVLDTY